MNSGISQYAQLSKELYVFRSSVYYIWVTVKRSLFVCSKFNNVEENIVVLVLMKQS